MGLYLRDPNKMARRRRLLGIVRVYLGYLTGYADLSDHVASCLLRVWILECLSYIFSTVSSPFTMYIIPLLRCMFSQ